MKDEVLTILRSISDGWIYEYKYNTSRKFKFDYANLPMKIAIEMEGGIYTGTGHAKTGTYLKDMDKYNDAQLKGWIVLRYSWSQINKIEADVRKAVEKRKREAITI